MADNTDALKKVTDQLLRMTAPQRRPSPITEGTEVYCDLGIYGDDIVELIWWLEKEFGVTTNINPSRYAPGEMPFSPIVRSIGKILGFETQYESLKVRDILAAIEAKRWPDEAAS
jgi:hypothetical protein